MTKFRLISFLPALRESILCGEKTQTRRLMKGWLSGSGFRPALCSGSGSSLVFDNVELKAKYGPAGSVLVVREPWAVSSQCDVLPIGAIDPCFGRYVNSDAWIPRNVWYSQFGEPGIGKRRSDRFMPYWAGRIFLVLESVKYEPVSWINEADSLAEGVKRIGPVGYAGLDEASGLDGLNRFTVSDGGMSYNHQDAKGAFGMLWDTLHTEEGTRFADSPMVWVYTFRLVPIGSYEWEGYRKELLDHAMEKWNKARALAAL